MIAGSATYLGHGDTVVCDAGCRRAQPVNRKLNEQCSVGTAGHGVRPGEAGGSVGRSGGCCTVSSDGQHAIPVLLHFRVNRDQGVDLTPLVLQIPIPAQVRVAGQVIGSRYIRTGQRSNAVDQARAHFV